MDIARVDRTLATFAHTPPPAAPFTIIAVGRLIAIKNPMTLLDAFIASALPDSRLVFVGTGPLDKVLSERAAAAGVADRVEFTGLLPREEVYRRLQQADLFVSTSYGEGLPIAVLEAMACRTPVILSAIPPHREIVDNLADMPLLAPTDQQGFAQAIQAVAALTPVARAALGERARKRVEESFSLAQMHRGYATIYAEVMGQQRVAVVTESFS
jgi:glycosyltransferase involved in cell wall biosynthesis